MTILTVRPAIVMRINTDPVIRVWTGSHDRILPPDIVDPEGGTYIGLGISEIPSIDRLLNGDAGEYTFTMSGLGEEFLQYVDEPAGFSGARLDLGEFKFDEHWQPVLPVEWMASYEAESMGVSLEQLDETDSVSVTVEMTVSSAMTDRRRAKFLHWSNVEQQAIDPTDLAYVHVSRYSSGSRRQYPA